MISRLRHFIVVEDQKKERKKEETKVSSTQKRSLPLPPSLSASDLISSQLTSNNLLQIHIIVNRLIQGPKRDLRIYEFSGSRGVKVNGLELLVGDSSFSGLFESSNESVGGYEIIAIGGVDDHVGFGGEGGEEGGVREGSW